MSVTVVIAVLAVLCTFSWIVYSSVRHLHRERATAIQCQTNSVALERQIRAFGVQEVEEKVMDNMREISEIAARRAPTKIRKKIDPEMTPTDLRAVDPHSDETRTMMAIRVKTEDIDRMARRKAKA